MSDATLTPQPVTVVQQLGLRWRGGASVLLDQASRCLAVILVLPLLAAAIAALSAGGAPTWHNILRGWEPLITTLELAAGTAAFALLLAATLVAAVSSLSSRWAWAWAASACLPLLIPSSLLGTAWIMALGRDGALTPFVQRIPGLATWNIYHASGVALALAWRYFGPAALLLLYERQRQQQTWPAEQVFSLRPSARIVYLRLLPLARAAIIAGVLLALLAMNDHILPAILLMSTYGTQIIIRYSALMDFAGTAALALLPAALGLALVAVTLALARRAWPVAYVSPPVPVPASAPWRRALGGAVALAVLAAALGVPIGAMAHRAGSWSALADALHAAAPEAWYTLRLAVIAGPLCAVVAAVIVAPALRQSSALPLPLVLTALNLAVPASLPALGLIELTNHGPLLALRDSDLPLILAYVVRFAPLVALLLWAFWQREPRHPVLAAQVHGIGGWRLLATIVWPQRRRSLACAALLAAVLVATELEMSLLLVPPGRATLGVRLYTMIHTAPDTLVSALALDVLLVTLPAIGLLAWVWGRRPRPRRVVGNR